jgi:hypothetical protein
VKKEKENASSHQATKSAKIYKEEKDFPFVRLGVLCALV